MRRVYQLGPDDCFNACLSSLFDHPLRSIPNFCSGAENGKLLPERSQRELNVWLKGKGVSYYEIGFCTSVGNVLESMELQNPDIVYLLTGTNAHERVHTVIAKGNQVIHDPATNRGISTLVGPCPDGHIRVGVMVKNFCPPP